MGKTSSMAMLAMKYVDGETEGKSDYLFQFTTGRERLIRSHSSARFYFELSGNSN